MLKGFDDGVGAATTLPPSCSGVWPFSMISATFIISTSISTFLPLDLICSLPKLERLRATKAKSYFLTSYFDFQSKANASPGCAKITFVLMFLNWGLPNF